MGRKYYEFPLTLRGYGDDPDEAWRDAVEGLSECSGTTPDDYTEGEDDENDEDE